MLMFGRLKTDFSGLNFSVKFLMCEGCCNQNTKEKSISDYICQVNSAYE